MKWLAVMAGLLVLLCGCAAPVSPPVAGQPNETVASAAADVTGKVGSMAKDSGAGLVQKASQPLNDLNLLENRIPPGVDDAAYVKASFLAAVAKSTETSPILTKEHATCKKSMPRYRFCDFLAMASRPFFLRF